METQYVRTHIERLVHSIFECNTITEEGNYKILRKRRSHLNFLCSKLQLTKKKNYLKPVSKTQIHLRRTRLLRKIFSCFLSGGKNHRWQCRQVNTWNHIKEAKNFELWQLKRDNWERELPATFGLRFITTLLSNWGRKMALNTCNIL